MARRNRRSISRDRDERSPSRASRSTSHPRSNRLLALLEGLRPKQWIKNLFVFAGLVFTGNVTHPALLRLTLEAFAIFCALSSGQYLINDVLDRREDRLHP